jgi:predicted Fe-Mo cluster-binding NifX family protein
MNATIAIPFENGNVFQHFGKTAHFKIYKINDNKVVESQVERTEGECHEGISLWLVMRGVNAVICDHIGPGSLGALAAAGIETLAGVNGNADESIEKFISGELTPTSSPNCAGHHGHGCGCSCSSKCSAKCTNKL